MAPDLGAIEEHRSKDAAYGQRLRDLEAATAARNQVPTPIPPGLPTGRAGLQAWRRALHVAACCDHSSGCEASALRHSKSGGTQGVKR